MKKMKIIGLTATLAMALSTVAQATVIYEQYFDSAPTTVAFNGASIVGGSSPTLNAGEYAIAANANTYDFGGLEMAYTNDLNASGGARARSIGVAIDISGADKTELKLTFDVTQFGIPNVTANDQVNFGVWSFSGIDATTSTVGVDMQSNSVRFDPVLSATGSATFTQLLGGNQQMTSTGAVSETFTLGSIGAGDYIFVGWTSTSDDTEGTSTQLPKFAVDNVVLQTVPEPATLGLVGAFGVGILFIRRRFMI